MVDKTDNDAYYDWFPGLLPSQKEDLRRIVEEEAQRRNNATNIEVDVGWIPLTEAASRLEISVDAVRKIVKRRGVPSRKQQVLVPRQQIFVDFDALRECRDNLRQHGRPRKNSSSS